MRMCRLHTLFRFPIDLPPIDGLIADCLALVLLMIILRRVRATSLAEPLGLSGAMVASGFDRASLGSVA